MYIPLSARLTLFYALIVGLALWFFATMAYTQAEQRAYRELDNSLKSRAASVRLSKDILVAETTQQPVLLPSVDGLGTGGVSIEVFANSDNTFTLLATTTQTFNPDDYKQTGLSNLGNSRIPWDAQALRSVAQHPNTSGTNDRFTTITYQGQHVRVYTLQNPDTLHFIQTARSEQDIEQSLSDLRLLLLRGSLLVMLLVLLGGWAISRGVLTAVQSMTRAAQAISASRDFGKRVQGRTRLGRDELTTLAATFNQMLASLEEAYKRQQRFVADASHELRAPITSIRCNLDLLATAPDLPTEEGQAALADARAEAERMGRLVNDLLLLARADSNTGTQSPESAGSNSYKNIVCDQEIDLDSLLLAVFRQYRSLHQSEPGGKPRLLLQDITPLKVHGDVDQLKQAIVVLVDNALKYTPADGMVSLSLTAEDTWAVIRVSDTGFGILPEHLPHIFERFYRADRSRTRDHGGSGLGLAIAQSIVQGHQGRIEVESTPGKGSTFLLKVPVAHVS